MTRKRYFKIAHSFKGHAVKSNILHHILEVDVYEYLQIKSPITSSPYFIFCSYDDAKDFAIKSFDDVQKERKAALDRIIPRVTGGRFLWRDGWVYKLRVLFYGESKMEEMREVEARNLYRYFSRLRELCLDEEVPAQIFSQEYEDFLEKLTRVEKDFILVKKT